jgi:predicted small lipoprotein YifL
MLGLSACGQKGPLYLPDKSEQSSDKNKKQEQRHGSPLYKDARAWQ